MPSILNNSTKTPKIYLYGDSNEAVKEKKDNSPIDNLSQETKS